MTYLVLARKYRPQTFDQVVGQNHIIQTIENAILADRMPHAILLSGPRGTGKTTIARIIARAINCLNNEGNKPCNECNSCVNAKIGKASDIFEIDGASNNSVEQIRSLKENILYMPVSSQFKIYIIDEVHMLSGAAFNALLKTLEEPPEHILFIFATTEWHKIPLTVVSRCQHHSLRRIQAKEIQNQLALICDMENFDINSKSLETISIRSDGSMRDALTLIDQVTSCYGNNVTNDKVIELLGIVNKKLIHDVSQAIFTKNTSKILDYINDIYQQGYDLKCFYDDLLEHFRNLILLKIEGIHTKLLELSHHDVDIMQKQIENIEVTFINQILSVLFKEEKYIRNTNSVKLAIEIAFLKLRNIEPRLSIDLLIQKIDDLKKEISIQNLETAYDSSSKTIANKSNINYEGKRVKSSPLDNSSNYPTTIELDVCLEHNNIELARVWEEIKEQISKTKPSLAANLSHCFIRNTSDGYFEIEVVKNIYTLKIIEKNLEILKNLLKKYFGANIEVKLKNDIKHDEKISKPNKVHEEILNHSLVTAAINLFDGKIEDIQVNLHKKEY